MSTTLKILSGGAAQGLVRGVQERFEAEHGLRIAGTFGAVGLMKDKLLASEPCDLVILTEALIRELQSGGHAVPDSERALGVVKTGVAMKAGATPRAVDSPQALKALLEQAPGIYFPDPAKATAGIHFMKVLTALGLADAPASKLRTFPNGATAMAALAEAPEADAVGCTQVTEILYTGGVQLVGLLPPPFELSTVYTAAVAARAGNPAGAQALIELMASAEAAGLRAKGGFA